MTYSVYWIHHPDHTDMFTQGYVGISNNIKRRFEGHRNRPANVHLKNAINKYGWDNLVKEIVLIADKAYCLMIELGLRAEDSVGWNIVKGGGMPPIFNKTGWKHTKEANEKNRQAHTGKNVSTKTKQKISDSLKKVECATRFIKGKAPWNKGVALGTEATKHLHIEVVCPHCNKTGKLCGMNRWHMDNCKNKGELF